MDNKKSICKFFLKKKCDKGDGCNFIHDTNICRDYFFEGKCKRDKNCKFKHLEGDKKVKNKIRNTTNFTPSHEEPDMNVLVDIP